MTTLPPDARSLWMVGRPIEDEPRLRKHQLVVEAKRVIEAVALLDVTDLDTATLDALIAHAGALAGEIGALPSLAAKGGLAVSGGADGALVERSGVSGYSNPLAPPLDLQLDGETTRGSAVYTAAYEGPPGCLHGGFVAAAFDDLLGCAQMASGAAGFTGTLTVRMRRPTPLNVRIEYEGGLDRVEGRKIWCSGRSWHGDTLLAEAECLFISPRDGLSPNTPR